MPKRYEEIGDSEFDRYFYAASHAAVRGIGLALFKFRIEGAPYIPMDSAAIIGSNHIDGSDVVFVPTAVPNRHVSVIGRRGVMNPLFNRWGAVTIDRPEKGESLSREQLKIMQQPLLDGDLLQEPEHQD
jgi:1-acyl-sn-glycerol-3-phosphate acyltransferase